MNCYTIQYWYGTYTGTRMIDAETEDQAVAKMWRSMKGWTSLPMAYQAAKVIKVDEYYQDDEAGGECDETSR